VKIEVVCSWCQCHMGWKECALSDPTDLPTNSISHGICPECFEKEMADINATPINNTNQRKEHHHGHPRTSTNV
jgi:hypothetical protein